MIPAKRFVSRDLDTSSAPRRAKAAAKKGTDGSPLKSRLFRKCSVQVGPPCRGGPFNRCANQRCPRQGRRTWRRFAPTSSASVHPPRLPAGRGGGFGAHGTVRSCRGHFAKLRLNGLCHALRVGPALLLTIRRWVKRFGAPVVGGLRRLLPQVQVFADVPEIHVTNPFLCQSQRHRT
jgi:hypothetical protein